MTTLATLPRLGMRVAALAARCGAAGLRTTASGLELVAEGIEVAVGVGSAEDDERLWETQSGSPEDFSARSELGAEAPARSTRGERTVARRPARREGPAARRQRAEPAPSSADAQDVPRRTDAEISAPSSSDDAASQLGDLRRHVEVEAVEVAEVADSGAEDGAGADVSVAEPWPNYRSMRAVEVVDRLVAESDAALALLLLYERRNRARRTVLAAAERELGKRSRAAGG